MSYALSPPTGGCRLDERVSVFVIYLTIRLRLALRRFVEPEAGPKDVEEPNRGRNGCRTQSNYLKLLLDDLSRGVCSYKT